VNISFGSARFKASTAASVIAQADRSIRLYPLVKVFNKRVFLPIIAIYFVNYIGFSLVQLGLLGSLHALISLTVNIPTGYIADKYGKTLSMRIGALMMIISTIFFGLVANKTGIVTGIFFEALGFAFLSGASEGLVHDSLEVKKAISQYSKRLSRAQSIALVINAGIISVVPFAYTIDPRLPYYIGTGAFVILLIAMMFMGEVLKSPPHKKVGRPSISTAKKLLRYKNLAVYAILFGIVSAVYFSFDIMTLALKEFGLDTQYIGLVFAGASLFGAAIGLVVHHLKRLSIGAYMVVDVGLLLLPFVAATTGNPWLLAAAITVNIGFWRHRRTIYQAHLLECYPTKYKSTIISSMGTMENVNYLWIPIVVTGSAATFGISQGLGIIAVGILLVSIPFIFFGIRAMAPKDMQQARM